MTIFNFFNKALGKIGRILYNNHINWVKTAYFNFRSLPFKQAVKFPVYVYSNTSLIDLSGRVEITGEISPGMVKLGKKWARSFGKTRVLNYGVIKFGNNVRICEGAYIVVDPSGTLNIGNNVRIGENTEIFTAYKISIGNNTGIAYQSQILDSDSHYMINTRTREIRYCKAEIRIGDNNWIGSRTTIKKGTITPNNLIVSSSYSVLCKDYTKTIPENSVIGGIPAKLIATDYRRVFNLKSEVELSNYYLKSSDIYMLESDVDIDRFCV